MLFQFILILYVGISAYWLKVLYDANAKKQGVIDELVASRLERERTPTHMHIHSPDIPASYYKPAAEKTAETKLEIPKGNRICLP